MHGNLFLHAATVTQSHAKLHGVLALLLVSLSAAPTSGRFVLEVSGVPVAELRVCSDGTQYTYEATHFLDEGPAESSFTFVLAELTAPPEVLTLLTRPAVGCRDVTEERTGKHESLCVDAGDTGTIDGQRYTARYDAQGRLASITIGPVRWTATSRPTAPPAQGPFARGVAVPEGSSRLEPAVKGARWWTRPPLGIAAPEDVGRTRCLLLARRALEGHPERRLAVGLIIEAGRAYPHAWVVEGNRALDPSVEKDDEVLQRRRYLEVPRGKSGLFFLQLFEGTQRVVKQ